MAIHIISQKTLWEESINNPLIYVRHLPFKELHSDIFSKKYRTFWPETRKCNEEIPTNSWRKFSSKHGVLYVLNIEIPEFESEELRSFAPQNIFSALAEKEAIKKMFVDMSWLMQDQVLKVLEYLPKKNFYISFRSELNKFRS